MLCYPNHTSQLIRKKEENQGKNVTLLSECVEDAVVVVVAGR